MKRKNIILAIVAVIGVLQFFQIDKSNPDADPSQNMIAIENPPAEVAEMLKSACYDCHSYETEFPWYTSIQPLAWWIRGHIRGGRQNMNFSEWGSYDPEKRAHKLEELAEEVQEGHMPLKSYTWMHTGAQLSGEQRNQIVAWANSTTASSEMEHEDDDD